MLGWYKNKMDQQKQQNNFSPGKGTSMVEEATKKAMLARRKKLDEDKKKQNRG